MKNAGEHDITGFTEFMQLKSAAVIKEKGGLNCYNINSLKIDKLFYYRSHMFVPHFTSNITRTTVIRIDCPFE